MEDENYSNNDKSPSSQCQYKSPPRIQALSKQVVDRIAAGEVIARPASIIKELIENSLDASSTTIDIQISNGGLSHLSVADNGHGFYPDDLPLAAVRFATSKLVQFEDLKSIKTFGFRGEALASASMVGRLTITSRRRRIDNDNLKSSQSSCAYKMSYTEGKPNTKKPIPAAGKEGTVVKIEDLFYNLQSRKRAFEGTKKENEEYYKILGVVQRYAIHCSKRGVGFVCRKRNGNTDLNTMTVPSLRKLQQFYIENVDEQVEEAEVSSTFHENKLSITAIKETIGHVHGTQLINELLTLEASEGSVDEIEKLALHQQTKDSTDSNKLKDDKTTIDSNKQLQKQQHLQQTYENIIIQADTSNNSNELDTFAFKAFGLLSNASFCGSKSTSAFILFINDRLVESSPIRRSIEGMYQDILPRGVKPFIYLSLSIPGIQVDVNIHPTKREVALLHEEKLCTALSDVTKKLLCSSKSSKTFYTQTLFQTTTKATTDSNSNNDDDINMTSVTKGKTMRDNYKKRKMLSDNDSTSIDKTNDQNLDETVPTNSAKKKRDVQPKDLIRINVAAEKGSIEPFLTVPTMETKDVTEKKEMNSANNKELSSRHKVPFSQGFVHSSSCEFANNSKKIDLNQPGAFTSICRCQIVRPGFKNLELSATSSSSPVTIPRPKKIIHTECSYSSIQYLRKDIITRAHQQLTTKLRESVFIGCVSRHRSLIQSGIELLIINHVELARELFYQLTLLQFGGLQKAAIGSDGVNVSVLVTKALQFEDAQSLFVAKQNDGDAKFNADVQQRISKQVTQCLTSHSEMLKDYFSIAFDMNSKSELILKGLPIILKGHSPSPHALPMFLLRLATQVNFTEEQACFEGVCTELAFYYAEIMPSLSVAGSLEVDDTVKKLVQHVLFPAFRYHLMPPKEFAADGSFSKLALLSKLYKIFERC